MTKNGSKTFIKINNQQAWDTLLSIQKNVEETRDIVQSHIAESKVLEQKHEEDIKGIKKIFWYFAGIFGSIITAVAIRVLTNGGRT